MSGKGLLALALVRAPYAHCAVVAPRCQQLAVGAPGHRPYIVTANFRCIGNRQLHPLPGEGSPSDPIQVIAQKMHLCPSKVAWHSPEGKCQVLMVLSQDPDTSVSLSPGLKAMLDT